MSRLFNWYTATDVSEKHAASMFMVKQSWNGRNIPEHFTFSLSPLRETQMYSLCNILDLLRVHTLER